MTTESDAVLATIVDNWGNGGYGGATPAIQSTADISVDRWAALDAVIVLHDTLDELHPPVNDKYVDKQYTMDIRVTSITDEDQLKLLVEEVEYLLNNTAITGFTSCRIIRKWRGSSDRKRKVYRNDITIELWARVSSSAIAPSGGTGTGLTGAYIEDLLMWGSANAAWVPCPFEFAYVKAWFDGNSTAGIQNTGNNDFWPYYAVPLPTNKGSLKLYVAGTRLELIDADASNFVTAIWVYGHSAGSRTLLDTDGTNKDAIQEYEDTFTAVDCSSYDAIKIQLQTDVADAYALEIGWVLAKCYYAA